MSGGAQPKTEPEHTHAHRTPEPGEAWYKKRAHTTTHTPQHPSQEWRGTSRAGTQAHTGPDRPARSGGAQRKPEPKQPHPHRTPEPGEAWYKKRAHTNTHTPQHPSQEWRCAAETRAQAHTPTPHTRARRGMVQEESAHKHTHTPTPRPGVAGRSRNLSPSTHTHTLHTPARKEGVQDESTHKNKHTPTAQPEVAGRSRNPSPSTHTHTAHPSQERRGTREERTQTHTHPNTPARSGGEHPTPQPKRNHPHGTARPGVAGYKLSAHTSTHTPQHSRQEWRGAVEKRARTDTCTPHTPARSGWRQAERAHKHTQAPTAQPGVARRSRNPSPSTHTHTAHPSQERRGTRRERTQTHTHPNTPARSGRAQPKHEPKHTRPHCTAQPGVAGYKGSAHANTHTLPIDPGRRWGAEPKPEPKYNPDPNTSATQQ